MTVADLMTLLRFQDPDAMVVVDGQELSSGLVLPVRMSKVPGTPAWGDQGRPRYAMDDDGDIKGVSIG